MKDIYQILKISSIIAVILYLCLAFIYSTFNASYFEIDIKAYVCSGWMFAVIFIAFMIKQK